MADEEKKDTSEKRINEKERFRYIGFEVFPGKTKDLFKSGNEKEKLVEALISKREQREIIRDGCTLMEERVSLVDRLVLTIASVMILFALFLPWYSAYNEIVEEVAATEPTITTDSTALMVSDDSLAMLTTEGDSLGITSTAEELPEEAEAMATTDAASEEIAAFDEGSGEITEESSQPDEQTAGSVTHESGDELIHSYVARKKTHREYAHLSGLGSFLSLGSVGSLVFSSGGILIITAILFLVMVLMGILIPTYTLYGIYGLKGSSDEKALKLKKIVKLNWIPVLVFFAALVLSFLGGEYGFDPTVLFTSIGDSYGPGVFLGSLSWGVFVSIAGYILIAVKGIEI